MYISVFLLSTLQQQENLTQNERNMLPTCSLGELVNSVHPEQSSSALLQEHVTGREWMAFSPGKPKCAARASCNGKIVYNISKNLF